LTTLEGKYVFRSISGKKVILNWSWMYKKNAGKTVPYVRNKNNIRPFEHNNTEHLNYSLWNKFHVSFVYQWWNYNMVASSKKVTQGVSNQFTIDIDKIKTLLCLLFSVCLLSLSPLVVSSPVYTFLVWKFTDLDSPFSMISLFILITSILKFVLLWQGDDRCPSLAGLKEFSQSLNRGDILRACLGSVCINFHLLFLQCLDYPLVLCLEGVSNNESCW